MITCIDIAIIRELLFKLQDEADYMREKGEITISNKFKEARLNIADALTLAENR